MQLVKVGEQFYQECKKHGTDKELLFNKSGRPCVLILKLKYKGHNRKFVVPFRSNIRLILLRTNILHFHLILQQSLETDMAFII